MIPIKDIVQRNHQSMTSGNPVKQEPNHRPVTTSFKAEHTDESLAIIDRLFLRLAAIYGNTWRNVFKSHEFLQFTKQEWLDGLAGYDERILYQAITICRENHKFPPTLPELLECCKYIKKKDVFSQKHEEIKPARTEVAEANLAQMKAILNMKH